MNNDCLGYDCDLNEIEEFRVLRFPFSSDIKDFDLFPFIDPRFYCLVRSSCGKVFGISVYDDWHKDSIRKYDGIKDDDEIPTIIKNVDELSYYEVASDCDKKPFYYERDREELRGKLDDILNSSKRKRRKK